MLAVGMDGGGQLWFVFMFSVDETAPNRASNKSDSLITRSVKILSHPGHDIPHLCERLQMLTACESLNQSELKRPFDLYD